MRGEAVSRGNTAFDRHGDARGESAINVQAYGFLVCTGEWLPRQAGIADSAGRARLDNHRLAFAYAGYAVPQGGHPPGKLVTHCYRQRRDHPFIAAGPLVHMNIGATDASGLYLNHHHAGLKLRLRHLFQDRTELRTSFS